MKYFCDKILRWRLGRDCVVEDFGSGFEWGWGWICKEYGWVFIEGRGCNEWRVFEFIYVY